MSPKAVAKMLKAEGWYGPKTTVYYIEFRVRRLRGRRQSGDRPGEVKAGENADASIAPSREGPPLVTQDARVFVIESPPAPCG